MNLQLIEIISGCIILATILARILETVINKFFKKDNIDYNELCKKLDIIKGNDLSHVQTSLDLLISKQDLIIKSLDKSEECRVSGHDELYDVLQTIKDTLITLNQYIRDKLNGVYK